ncbi:phosphoribosylglycinamide formyltransferase, putative [Talaromyces islandicus]|uniref:Phosphoribosylglycinamide formyltransferase n=1 Tax=Talaromyces islandicus TaxID=28573 RepID=A0A0U1LW41_TALIS|nr:phosphoribosylglycinamide formyltransferase, putative [Talaromyces islandicus]
MDNKTRLTVLISGSGTNLQAVIDKIQTGQLPARIVRVISNRKDAYGLERARVADIPTAYHNLVKYKRAHPATPEGIKIAREEYDAELAKLVLADSPELVACLGFMHVLSTNFLQPLEEKGLKIINLHPALPGAFNGVDAIERAHAAWRRGEINKTGVMIHDVISEVDMGTPILVKEIPFVAGEDENLEHFTQKVHETEWGAVIEGIQLSIQEVKEKNNRSASSA